MNRFRVLLVSLTVGCVLAGVVPSAIELIDSGWSEWLNVDEFHQNLSNDD